MTRDINDNRADDFGNSYAIFVGLISGTVLLRLFMSLYLDLTPDEAYYWELSRHLDWSYFDHPPMVAYILAFFRFLFGDTQLAVRLPSIVGMAISSWLIFKIGSEFLHSRFIGLLAVVMFNFTPAGMAVGFITTPDTPLAFFWVLGCYAFLKAINDTRDRWWAVTGFALGAGALSKYNMVFFVPGVAITILAFKKYRHLVFTRRYWIMVLLAAAGTIPIIYWNLNHDWISFKFQFDHGLKASNRSLLKNIGDFLGGQLGTIGLTLFPVIWFAVLKHARAAWRKADEVRFFLAWLALPMMAFFVYTAITSKVEANWPQIAYISAMILAAEWVASAQNTRRRNWVLGPSIFLALLVVIQAFTLLLPVPPRSDISTRLHGWKEMGALIQKADLETGHQAIFVGQGGPLAALVGFYGKLPPHRVAEVHGGGNYKFWWANNSLASGTDVIYVDEDRHSEAFAYSKRFAESASHTIPISFAGKHIRNLNLTTMKNLQSKFEFK